jgi:hypothetical protein
MAEPVRFPEQTHHFNKPKDMTDDECGGLPAVMVDVHGQPTYVSCWKLTPEEVENIVRTGVVWVGCVSMQPPLLVWGDRPFSTDKDHHNN